jgi:hypothetical protein
MNSEAWTRLFDPNAKDKYLFDSDKYYSSDEEDIDKLIILYNFLSLCYPFIQIIFIPDNIFKIILPPEDKSTCVKKISITYNISEKKYEITRFKKNNILFANDPIFFNTTDDIDKFISSYLTKK